MGSVFSPAYRSERRRSLFADPQRFCCINLAIYGPGRAWVYTEPRVRTVRRTPDRFDLSGSSLEWSGDALTVHIDERTAVAGRRVRGTITLHPQRGATHPLPLDPHGRHHWWGVSPGARIEVELQQPQLRFGGSGYHDANFGLEPLEDGFSSWTWSRVDLPEGTGVLYDVQPRRGPPSQRGMIFRDGGQIDGLIAAEPIELGRAFWGMPRTTRVDAGGSARLVASLEDSPFYTRSLLEVDLGGVRAPAVHESLSLDRFTHPVVQAMIRTRLRRGWRA